MFGLTSKKFRYFKRNLSMRITSVETRNCIEFTLYWSLCSIHIKNQHKWIWFFIFLYFGVQILFSQPPSYKDGLGKILYLVVCMDFQNTNGSIISLEKRINTSSLLEIKNMAFLFFLIYLIVLLVDNKNSMWNPIPLASFNGSKCWTTKEIGFIERK